MHDTEERRTARRILAVVMLAAVLMGVQLLLTHPLGALAARADGRSDSPTVSCLDAQLRPASSCPAVTVGIAVRVHGATLQVTVRNAGRARWAGGPVAVEVPLPAARAPKLSRSGSTGAVAGAPELAVRAGVVVGRCTFDPVPELRPGAAVSCSVPRTGLRDGPHDLWLTGFTGGLPPAGGPVGDDPVAVGVVPVALARSIRIELHGSVARLVPSPAGAPVPSTGPSIVGRPADHAGGAGGGHRWLVLFIPGVVLAVAAGALVRRRRRAGEPHR